MNSTSNKQEVFQLFEDKADAFGVCDMVTRDGTHERLRMGKEGRKKARFLACSRDGWICLYYDARDKYWMNDICPDETPVVNDESYDYRCRVEPEQFEDLLQKIADILGVEPRNGDVSSIQVNRAILERYMIGFRSALTQRGESVSFYHNSVFNEQEGYKNRILKDVSETLNPSKWKDSDIGSGSIALEVTKAVSKSGNLVNEYQEMHFKDYCASHQEEAETALFALFCGSDDEKAFELIKSTFGGSYGLIGYLFFIHDPKRYLPISPRNFDARFEKLEVNLRTSYKCSWENYTCFIKVIQSIQNELQNFLDVPVTLLDAHSFIWMMPFVDKYLDENATEENIITTVQRDTTATVSVRIGQSQYRSDLKNYWDNACSVTGCAATELLIASHIKPWRDCHVNNEWIDKYNGLLLTPNLDKAFDYGYITFDDNGKIVISERLSEQDKTCLGINEGMALRKITDKHRYYLVYHRENIFDKF